MGRKPNAIVSEFFSRGAKLHDSSNRYEHTCKLCGENFPKGRTDSLLGHLLKTCQAIPTADRQRVDRLTRTTSERGSGSSKKAVANGRIGRGKGVDLPFATKQAVFNSLGGLNGLNVLAEASRQVGASDNKQPNDAAQELSGVDKPVVVDPTLELSNKSNGKLLSFFWFFSNKYKSYLN